MLTVFVCGLPSSGNHLLQRILGHNGITAKVYHGPPRRPYHDGMGHPTHAVIPVRNPRCRLASATRRKLLSEYPEAACRANVLAFIHRFALPVKLVSYEALIQDPVAVTRDLTDWLGVPYVGVGEEITDANAKYDKCSLEAPSL